MRLRLAPFAACALALTPAAALAGCGSSLSASNGVASKTPAQILASARSAAAGAATVHVAGSIVSEGKPISLDMELVARKGGEGRITLDGLSIQLIEVDRRRLHQRQQRLLQPLRWRPSARGCCGEDG